MLPSAEKPRLLLLHAGALGDCVLAIHFARIASSSPARVGGDHRRTSVTIAARSSIIHWAEKNGLIDSAVNLDSIAPSLWRSQDAPPTADWTDFLSSFDTVISLLGCPSEPVSANLRRDCKTRIHCVDPRHHSIPAQPPRHIIDQWLERLIAPTQCLSETPKGRDDPAQGKALGSKAENQASPERAQHVVPDVRTELSRRCRAENRPIVLIHPGSGGQSKCCDLVALERLIPIFQHHNLATAWIVGPDEMERCGAPYARRLERTAPLIYEESVEAAADLVAAADAYIGMDAGMTHVAALAGVNTVALFGPTDPAVWRPLGRSVHVLPFPTESPPAAAWLKEIERCVLSS